MIVKNPQAARFEAWIDEELAGFLDYREESGQLVLPHTFVFEKFGGQGIGKQLAAAAVAEGRALRLEIVPECPFVARYLAEEHPSG